MKTMLIIVTVVLGGFVFSHHHCSAGSCFPTQISKPGTLAGMGRHVYTAHTAFTDTTRMTTVKLKVTGLDCAGCANFIHKRLSVTNGIISDEVKYPGDITIVKYNADKISDKKIAGIINKLGYKTEILTKNK